jgi:hypothetical protein
MPNLSSAFWIWIQMITSRERRTMSVETIANLRGDVGKKESLIHRTLRNLGISSRDHMTSIISTPEVLHQLLLSPHYNLQSWSLALNNSGTSSSSLKTDFDRSPFVEGCPTSFERADSRGTGFALGAAGVGVLARLAAVKCSAVYR